MKKFLKILTIAAWVLAAAGAVFLLGWTEVRQAGNPCRRVVISIDYGNSDILVSRDDIDSIIFKTAGNVSGKPLRSINTGRIEKAILKQPYVASVSVYETMEGVLSVDIRQREPILRIINDGMENFYLDKSGTLLPVNPVFSARVLAANGFILDSYIKNPNRRINIVPQTDSVCSDSLMNSLYKLAMYISQDKFFKSQIDQIYVTRQQEFELVPRIGNHLILFGKAGDIDAKFRKLYAFYRLGLNRIGWNRYNLINIKYKDQVICTNI